jgi:hypothetical protein
VQHGGNFYQHAYREFAYVAVQRRRTGTNSNHQQRHQRFVHSWGRKHLVKR